MSKAENFIKEHTRNCSNQIINGDYGTIIPHFNPWLTPDQARKAVEIAREEAINDVCDWIISGLDVKNGILDVNVKEFVEDIKQAMKDD